MQILSFLLAAAVATASSTLQQSFEARNPEELLKASRKQARSKEEILRGRRRLQNGELETSDHILADSYGGVPGFYHSVASGDPLADAVILWTRYTPEDSDETVVLEFRIAKVDAALELDALLNPTLNPDVKRGQIAVRSESDFVAKIDVTGLESNTRYVYVFLHGSTPSDIGITRTAPAPGDDATDLTYAFFSCAHFANGFFHAYDAASTIEDLDIAIHVGDYYYEYGIYGTYAQNVADVRNQFILPPWETVDLQDYRNRHASYVGNDEGLRNLRRRVPLIAIWDDHETTNDSYGNSVEGAGGENHQETCPSTPESTDEEKARNQCDRNEGDAVERFSAAAQAYMDWMPIRVSEGNMGRLGVTGTLTQIIEWGDLATIVALDSRMSYRSTSATRGNALGLYAPAAEKELNISAYMDPRTTSYKLIQQTKEEDLAIRNSDECTIIGEYLQLLEDTFRTSKAAGKPWQIYASSVMMGHYVLPDPSLWYLDVPKKLFRRRVVKRFIKLAMRLPKRGLPLRVVSLLAQINLEWNLDDFSACHSERAKIMEIAKNVANNMIILGGDLHDSFGWVMVEGGLVEGEPVAVNLGTPGTASPGFGPIVEPILAPIEKLIGGRNAMYDIIHKAYYRQNPNLKFVNVRNKGFVAIRANKDAHTAEWIGFSDENMRLDYDAARAAAGEGALTARTMCLGSYTTNAATPGSLERNKGCSAIRFSNQRPAVYGVSVAISDTPPEGEALADCGYTGCVFGVTIFDIKKFTADRQAKFREMVKELYTMVNKPVPGRMLVLNQHYSNNVK